LNAPPLLVGKAVSRVGSRPRPWSPHIVGGAGLGLATAHRSTSGNVLVLLGYGLTGKQARICNSLLRPFILPFLSRKSRASKKPAAKVASRVSTTANATVLWLDP